jgi:hypothetical protein
MGRGSRTGVSRAVSLLEQAVRARRGNGSWAARLIVDEQDAWRAACARGTVVKGLDDCVCVLSGAPLVRRNRRCFVTIGCRRSKQEWVVFAEQVAPKPQILQAATYHPTLSEAAQAAADLASALQGEGWRVEDWAADQDATPSVQECLQHLREAQDLDLNPEP